MNDLVPGFIAALLLVLFLGFYAMRIESIALWIIVGSVAGLMILDYVQSVRSNGNSRTG